MYLKAIEIENYRNYASLAADFSPGINIFIGENAQGKTNLMEAIYVLALARSHRTNKDRELIKWDADFARIKGLVQDDESSFPLEISISKQGKKAKLNRIEQKRLSSYIGHLNVILFAPEDLTIVKGSPSERRRFIDREMGQMSPIYLYHLSQYQQVLRQRNQYLKDLRDGGQSQDFLYLDVLTEQLAVEASHVLKYRYQFIEKLEAWSNKIHRAITKGKEDLRISYKSSCHFEDEVDKSDAEALFPLLMDQYQAKREQELYQQTSLLGPHRDDMVFYINDKPVQTYGSQGQQRTTTLSLKLAEIDMMKEMTGKNPILLLDDVLSELDDERQTYLLRAIQDTVQTFLTTTNLSGVKRDLIKNPRVFQISQGQIEMESESIDEWTWTKT